MSFQTAFDALLAAWRSHEELRTHGAGFEELLDSQIRLEQARHDVRMTRSMI